MTSFTSGQNCVNHIFCQKKKNLFLRGVTQYFHGLDLLFTCLHHLQGMQMIFSMLFLNFTFKDQNLAENLTNFTDTPKIVWLCRVHGARFLQLQGTLDTWWNQGNTKCQGEWWSGLSRESQRSRPCWTLVTTLKSLNWDKVQLKLKKYSNSDKIQQLKLWSSSTTQIVTNLKNSNSN